MTISFDMPSMTFWAKATSQELAMLDLQELHSHIFGAHPDTTIAFLEWLPESDASTDVKEQGARKLTMMQAPNRYCNEDCDKRGTMLSWALHNVPAGLWHRFRNSVAYG